MLKRICKICALIWICTLPIAFLTTAITNGDFTHLGTLLEQPHMQENYILVKVILNIGLNLHIGTALPAAISFVNTKPQYTIGKQFYYLHSNCDSCDKFTDTCHLRCKKPPYELVESEIKSIKIEDAGIYIEGTKQQGGWYEKTAFLSKAKATSKLEEYRASITAENIN